MPSTFRSNRIHNAQTLALDLAQKAMSFKLLVQEELCKEQARLHPEEGHWNTSPDNEKDFPLLHRYMMFHTQLIALEKDSQDRQEGFVLFSDIYAQTVTYGLLAARWLSKDRDIDFTRINIPSLLPITSKFLKNILIQLLDVESSICVHLCIQDMIATLSNIDIHVIFGKKSRDPMIHFYEDFLYAYDQEKRQDQGVYYTPPEIVDFIVCDIDTKLKKDFGLPLGLASTKTWDEVLKYLNHGKDNTEKTPLPKLVSGSDIFVRILDPATGTGTFITRVIKQIRDNLKAHWKSLGWSPEKKRKAWSHYLCGTKGNKTQGLFHRLFAFELMVVPYIITHLRVGLLLQEDKEFPFIFDADDRLQIFLTNALERSEDRTSQPHMQYILQEKLRVDAIKENTAIPIILGNPPYNARANRPYLWFDGRRKPPQKGAVEEYKYVDGVFFDETKHWLSDEYVKFIKLAEQCIKKSGIGILGFINPHGMYDNPTFRGMRWFLLSFYSHIDIVDLHGNVRRKEVDEDGTVCENVFLIKTGVGINIFTRLGSSKKLANVRYTQKKGSKTKKLRSLKQASIQWTTLNMSLYSRSFDHYFFVPKDFRNLAIYSSGVCVIDLFRDPHIHSRGQSFSSGIITANDALLIQISRKKLVQDIKRVLSNGYTKEDMQREFNPGNTYLKWFFTPGVYRPSKHKKAKYDATRITRLIYRPLDFRYTYYDPLLIHQSRSAVMKPLLKENLAIIISRTVQGDAWRDIQVTDAITEFGIMASRVGNAAPICPIFHYRNGIRESNFNQAVVQSLVGHYGAQIDLRSTDCAQEDVITGMDIIYYILAILSSPRYRSQYQELLKIGYPFVPKHHSIHVFRQLVHKGKELRELHLLESDLFKGLSSRLISTDSNIEPTIRQIRAKASKKPKAKQITHWNGQIWINDHQYFENVSERAWNFYIGGYRPAHKWLKDRKGTTLTSDELVHYTKIIVALEETHRVMGEIDEIIGY